MQGHRHDYEFRRLAAEIDQHMQRLAAEDVNDASATINCMVGYMSGLRLAGSTQNKNNSFKYKSGIFGIRV